jgi:hypothetical protein
VGLAHSCIPFHRDQALGIDVSYIWAPYPVNHNTLPSRDIPDDIVTGYERNADDFVGNLTAHIDATVTAFDSVENMIGELKHLSEEVISFILNLPLEFISWKCNYMNLGNILLNGMLPHTQSHIEQIRSAIASARK